MSGLEDLILKRKQERVIKLLNEITIYSDISILDVTLYLGYSEEQHSSMTKCAQGKRFPNFLNSKIDVVLKKLEQGVKNPDLIYASKESLVEDERLAFKKLPKSSLVWIPFYLEMPVVDYNGNTPPLSIIQMGTHKGIVAFRSTSNYEADGEIYVDHVGVTTEIEPGTKIAIKRIYKEDWQTDCFYLIIDASGQKSIRVLLPGDDNKTVKYISLSVPEGPHKVLPIERIVAMFSIVDGNYIPRPKRNSVTASTTQQ